jgi:asparagine synthase (glutamine-hydrolysing)
VCGITGYLLRGRCLAPDTLARMTASLAHRGPDDEGTFIDEAAGVGLGHRRLSIIDLSAEGRQPMLSESGRYVVSFNGEIYNHQLLRSDLHSLGTQVRRQSDTAVLLAALDTWGLQDTLPRLIGIFAFALWDSVTRELHLVRDHVGVKPLYHGYVGDSLVFGSELRPLTLFPGFEAQIDRNALALLLRYNCIPAPFSIYRGVGKLGPGSVLTHGAGGARVWQYWSARATAEAGVRSPLILADGDAVDQLDDLLGDAVGLQMVADVPLGAFLSGGIDSSLVVALMQAQSARPVRTFAIGFEGKFNEAPHARAVAAHLGTDHTEMYVTAADAVDLVPSLPQMYDEPFADSSQLPTLLVSRLARRSVTVSLSGDGGDELFGGYNRHRVGERLWRRLARFPMPFRRATAAALHALPIGVVDSGVGFLPARGFGFENRIGYKLQKLADVMTAGSPVQLYGTLVSHWKDPAAVVLGAVEPATPATSEGAWPQLPTFTEQMLCLDLAGYLPDDILTKVDRASMNVALEARVPLLDPRVVEFAWRLPLHQKLRNGTGKWVLREVLQRYVPRSLTDRPKSGFAVPLGTWLRGPLRDWAESLLDARGLEEDGFFRPSLVRQRWEEHVRGRRDWAEHLWDVLMFQAWFREQRRGLDRCGVFDAR